MQTITLSYATACAAFSNAPPGIEVAGETVICDEVMARVGTGCFGTVSDIAARLHLSGKTVSTHKARILEKMGMDSVADPVRYAMAHKLNNARDT